MEIEEALRPQFLRIFIDFVTSENKHLETISESVNLFQLNANGINGFLSMPSSISISKHVAPLCVVENHKFIGSTESNLETADLKGAVATPGEALTRQTCRWQQIVGGQKPRI